MALDAADWTVATNGDIRWTGAGTATNVTVLELHRFLQDLADDAVASGDDLLDISDNTPSDRATDNIVSLINNYNIDDTAAQHIFDGSITQSGGDVVYSGLVVVGAVESGTNLQLVQNNEVLTSYWGAGLNADPAANILLRIMVKTRDGGVDIDGKRIRVFARELGDTYGEFSATLGSGNSTAAVFTGPDLNNQTASGTIATYDQFTNTEGYQQFDVSGDGANEDYYSKWTWGSGSVPASPAINDLYEWTKYESRRGSSSTLYGFDGELFRGITHQWDYDGESGSSPSQNQIYVWGTKMGFTSLTGGFPTNGTTVIGGTSGAKGRLLGFDFLNSNVVVSTESGTFQASEALTFGSGQTANVSGSPVGQATGGGAAALLAIDDNGTTGTVWVQLIKGSPPSNNTICYRQDNANNVLTVDGSVTARTLSPAFLGTSTGSAIIGAFGIGIDPSVLTASDQLFDLTNAAVNPPNNVTFSVNGVVSGQDRILVGPESGGALEVDQFGLNAALTTNNVTSITIDTTIPSDTPSAGTIRVFDNDGVARRLSYSSYTGATFTITTTDGNEDFGTVNADAGNDVFISYIDDVAAGSSISFTSVYSSDRALFIRVRDGGASPIKTFETTGTLGSAGGSATAIRTSDV